MFSLFWFIGGDEIPCNLPFTTIFEYFQVSLGWLLTAISRLNKCSDFVEWKGKFSPDIIEIKYEVRRCVIAFVTTQKIIIIVLFKNDLHFMCN